MSKLKKILAVILSMTMVFAMGTIAYGADSKIPSAKDTGSITVTNLKENDTVKVYQFVKANYNKYGFIGYSAINNLVKNPIEPTSDEVISMASNVSSMTVAGEAKVAKGKTEVVINNLSVGYYLVVVTSGSETVYSPMIAGVYYSKSATENTITNGAINADTKFVIKGQQCWAKSSTPKLEKTIVKPSSNNAKGDDVAIGDIITFNLTSTVPSYSKEYKKATYKIYDTMSEGLDYVENSVKCFMENGDKIENIKADVKVNGKNIVITFDSKFILEHPGQTVQVEYNAKLNEKAGLNFDANTNKAYLEYTNSPKCNSTAKTKDDIVYLYTFGIDSKLFGNSTEKWNEKTKELIKVGEGEFKWTEIKNQAGSFTTTTALEGATFVLENNKTKATYTAISDKNGYLNFSGLDAGEYTLQEVKAPEGYTLNDAKHSVVITALYNQDGTLKSYTIKIDNKATSTYTATYENKIVKNITKTLDSQGHISETTILKNAKMGFLPSTGGVGTTIFAIIGVMFAATGIGLYMAFRGKNKVQE